MKHGRDLTPGEQAAFDAAIAGRRGLSTTFALCVTVAGATSEFRDSILDATGKDPFGGLLLLARGLSAGG